MRIAGFTGRCNQAATAVCGSSIDVEKMQHERKQEGQEVGVKVKVEVEVDVEVKAEEGDDKGAVMAQADKAMAGAEAEAKAASIKRAKKLMLPKDLPAKYDHAQWRPKHGKDAGTAELQPYHRAKLRALLTSLLQEHLYSAASGPVSVLLQAHTREDVYQNLDLHYFWVWILS